MDPSTQDYHDLKKLFEEVSAKVMIAHKKGVLSEAQLAEINGKLALIAKELQKAQSEPIKTISSKMSPRKVSIKNALFKEKFIKVPKTVSGALPEFQASSERGELPEGQIDLTGLKSFSLNTYTSIKTPHAFMDNLTSIHQLRKERLEEIFRFFSEVRLSSLTIKGEKNEASLWWKLSDQEVSDAMQMILEITEELAKIKRPENISQYEFESLENMTFLMEFFSSRLSGRFIDLDRYSIDNEYVHSDLNASRFYQRATPNLKASAIDPLWALIHRMDIPTSYTMSIPGRLLEVTLTEKGNLFTDTHSLDLSSPGVSHLFPYRILMQDILGDTKGFYTLFGKKYFTKLHWDDFYKKAEESRWIKPMGNPYLIALYKEALLSIREGFGGYEQRFYATGGESLQRTTDRDESLIADVPEAFHSNPEGAVDYFFQKIKKNPNLSSLKTELSSEVIKALSRLLRTHSPQEELIAFMHEYPHLMMNPQIRNFFDALFFGPSLLLHGGTIGDPTYNEDISIYPIQIKEEIARLQEAPDLDSQQLLLYYIEMYIKLQEVFAMKKLPLTEFNLDVEGLLKLERDPSLMGYSARLLLRSRLAQNKITAGNGAEILQSFVDVLGTSMDRMNKDPYFEEAINRHWVVISKNLKDWDLEPATYTDLIERFFFRKNIALDGSAWVQTGELIFQNDQYVIDLNQWSINPVGTKDTISYLPGEIQANAYVRAALPFENLAEIQAVTQESDSTLVYSFCSSLGAKIQIEQDKGVLRLYRQIPPSSTWLEFIPTFEEQGFLRNGIYVDPKQRKVGFIFGREGNIDFEVALTCKKGSLTIKSFTDCRTDPKTSSWKINPASSCKNESLAFLNHFENPESIVLWTQHKHLKKIELPRYQLTFALENGRLKCLTEPMVGYFIDPNASLKEKKGYRFALLLEHPDQTKSKKLILPDVKAIESKEVLLLPKARGIPALKAAFNFKPKMTKKKELGIASKEESLAYTSIDIRRETNEWIKKRKEWPETVFALIEHATIMENALLAHSWYKKFPFKEAIQNRELLQKMLRYCQSPSASTIESALKFKLSLGLLNALKTNKKLTTTLKATLHGIILETGKQQLAQGRRVPGLLALTSEEEIQFANIAKKIDPEFFNQHLTVYFLKKGKSFDLASPIDEKDTHFQTRLEAWREESHEPVKPNDLVRLDSKDLSSPLALTEDKIPLLFTKKEVLKLFTSQTVQMPELKLDSIGHHPYEQVALKEFQKDLDRYHEKMSKEKSHLLKANKKTIDRFMRTKLVPKQIAYEQEMQKLKLEIQESLIKDFSDEDKIAFYAGRKKIPTFEELRLQLIQDTIDVSLKTLLIGYYDAFAKHNAADSAMALLRDFQSRKQMDPKAKELMSNAIYKLLTLERNYDPNQDVRLLIFEAQTFKNFRPLDGGLHQLDLLEALIKNPHGIVQAPTGAGKTSVLSVMSSLIKANGKNLVVQKVLPPLYEQTHEQLHDVLEGVFETLVMPLRFNLKMRMTIKETYFENKEQKTRDASIFKGMYESLCQVIENKGCVLTDYTSLPLLEEKFFKLGQELYENSLQGIGSTDLEREHYDYLRKILLLLESKAIVNMDEFDGPNRPIQKLQLSFGPGSDLPNFLADTTQEIYVLLAEDETLALKQNIQGDLTKEMRQASIEKAAKAMAKNLGYPALVDYFLGKNEEGLDQIIDPDLLDKLALCKDQFSIYLPLTLSYNQGSRYARTADGAKTVPCKSGEKREAKFGTILEQMNYTIQDYLQCGITAYDLETWFQDFGENFKTHQATQNEFAFLFDPYTVDEVVALFKTTEGINTLVEKINQSENIAPFLNLRLKKIKASGVLISMDPGNSVDMNRADSGISATTGLKGSLHSQFQEDQTNGHVRAEMAYRIFKRADGVISYDPENPKQILDQLENISVIIDGADAYKNHPKQAAEDLKDHYSKLKGVEYKDDNDKSRFIGIPTNHLEQRGYVFKESNTVGMDIRLADNAKAVLTLNEKHGMRDYSQKEGRLRQPGQTCTLALSKYLEINTLEEAMAKAVCIDAGGDAKDVYLRCKQELHGIVRYEMKKKLLASETIEDFLGLFKENECRALFITPKEANFQEKGSYFAARKHIEKADTTPKKALKALKKKCRAQAEGLGLEEAITRLDHIQYSGELLNQMLPHVSSSQAELEMELQMEEEQENEMEQEMELQIETLNQVEEMQTAARSDVLYPKRLNSQREHNVGTKIHSAYHPALFVSDNFLPFSREKTNSLFERKPFDSSMYRIGEIIIHAHRIIIEDPLKDNKMRKNARIIYDIRTNKITAFDKVHYKNTPVLQEHTIKLIAQVKFLDGRTDGYLPEEVKALKEWLTKERPERMKNHLLQEILKYRYSDQLRFKGSQLEEIFNSLI